MLRLPLTMSQNYVRDWTYVEAVRELFQNALDQQVASRDNEMFFSYENGFLTVGSKTSVLDPETLLIGNSTKSGDKDTIGRHGEGYKVAFLVLLREGKKVTVYNYGRREVWTTELAKMDKLGDSLVPTVTIKKKRPWQTVPSHNLLIEVEGITEEEYANIVESNLHLQSDVEYLHSSNKSGSVLLDPKYKGHFYVNGLFICQKPNFEYGYSLPPRVISLDRDRKLLDTINLMFLTSSIWRYVGREGQVADMLMREVPDVKYVKVSKDFLYQEENESFDSEVSKELHTRFVSEHGTKAVPVSSNSELQKVLGLDKNVSLAMVSEDVKGYLGDSVPTVSDYVESPKDRLELWVDKVAYKLSSNEVSEIRSILNEL